MAIQKRANESDVAYRERDEARAEAARYRAALKSVIEILDQPQANSYMGTASEIAGHALGGGDD